MLRTAMRNLQIMEEALRALRDQLAVANPRLLETTEGAYKRRIATLKTEIGQREHPRTTYGNH
jgi:hypothetical protein